MRGSEPGSSRSSSRKVRRGTYSGPSARRVTDHACSPSSSLSGSSSGPTCWMRVGVVGRELAAHHLGVEAAGHQGHAVHVPGQLQGEGFGDGDGLEQVLDAQQGALPGPWRRHRQQDRTLLALVVSKQDVLRVQLQCSTPFSNGRALRVRRRALDRRRQGALPVLARPPLDDLRLLRGGLDADGEAVALRQQQPVSPRA